MGGTPLTALAILGYATCDYGPAVIRNLLNGAINKLKEAGACLIGGHSIEDNEFKLGFAVTGVLHKNRILKADSAAAGNILILTKPLGTGILTSAVKLNKMKKQGLNKVIASMLKLNKDASLAAVHAGAKAATDVTGFGLLGHALNMAQSSRADVRIFFDQVPVMNRVIDFIASGVIPKGAKKNLEFCGKNVSFAGKISHEEKLALADPQTSGGLLIALPEKALNRFTEIANKSKMQYWIIGEFTRGKGKIKVL
jgi:selenide,water dikinase